MPTRVEITIRGLALCYVTGDGTAAHWNVHFVCDDNHPLYFTDPTGPKTEVGSQNHDFDCEFTGSFGTGSLAVLPPELFNINGPQAHNKRLQRVHRNCFDTSKVALKLPPSAAISVRALSKDYYVQEVGAGSRPVPIAQIATVLRFDFDISSTQMDFRIGNATHEHYKKTFAAASNTIKFSFDNRCTSCHRNDSLELYDIVSDPGVVGERFFVTGELNHTGNVPDHDAVVTCAVDPSGVTQLSMTPSILTYPYGNCDPVASEPPPG